MAGKQSHSVRIIGGRWRGRRLPVLDYETLRPTKDIVRETLFNWLQPVLPGSRCLDAFAGSGALGFEAASRDAAEVVMLEPAEKVFQNLVHQVKVLSADKVSVHSVHVERYLQRSETPFDIVFLDPPFNSDLLSALCRQLADEGHVYAGGRIYIEAAKASGYPELPANWRWLRQQTAGDVVYGLAVTGG